MGLALTGARWTRKPPPGTDLDRTHPLCPDHCWPLLAPQGTAQSLAKVARLADPSTRGDIYAAGSSQIVPGRKYGLSVRHGSLGDCLRLTSNTDIDRVVPGSGGWTMLICYRKTDATLRSTAAFGSGATTGGIECTGFIPYSDGVVYFDYGGSVAGTTRLSVSGLSFGDDLWVFATGLGGMQIWQNGLLRASNAANPTRTTSASTYFAVGPFTAFTDFADTALVMSWRRQLAAADIRAVSINPWQLFQPVTTLVIAPTITAPSVSRFPALMLAP